MDDYEQETPNDSYEHTVVVTIGECEVEVTVHLKCIEFSTKPSGQYGPPEFYDPGSGPDFELNYAMVSVENKSNGVDEVKLTDDLFWALLGDKAHLAYDAAYEAAQDSGEF